MRNAAVPISLMAIVLLAISMSWAAYEEEWVTPAYPARPSEEHTVTLKYSYTYDERQFTPAYAIEPLSKDRRTLTSPESAMIARGAAMKELDYEGWLATWDDPSKSEMEQRAKEHNHELRTITDQWREVLVAGHMAMVRRIQTGNYVIVTYRIVDDAGQDISGIELPSVFHLVDGQWLGTQELSGDVLLLESPWVTGKEHVERVIR
jgi:hypothetical protein